MTKETLEPTLFGDDFGPDNSRPIDEIAEQLGDDVAKKIITAYGGTRLYIPATARVDHPLTMLIGFDNAVKLGQYFSGERIVVPKKYITMAYIRKNVPVLWIKGWKIRDIALAMDCCERTVFKILNEKQPPKKPSLPLFKI